MTPETPTLQDSFLAVALAYCERAGIRPDVLSRRALGNSHLFRRLQGGGRLTTDAYERVLRYIAENPAPAAGGDHGANLYQGHPIVMGNDDADFTVLQTAAAGH